LSDSIRLVLDTNILAAAVAGSLPSMELVLRWIAGDFVLCVSSQVRLEYKRVLPGIPGNEALRGDILLLLQSRGHVLSCDAPEEPPRLSPHEPDNHFIACALTSQAHALITHNERHFIPWATREGVVVSRPREYLPLLP